jgi:hypothetical protein
MVRTDGSFKILTHHIKLFQSNSAAHAEVCARSSAAEVHSFNYRWGSKYVHYTDVQVRINKDTLCVHVPERMS